MKFDWAEYQRLADELAARTSDGAALRSAISRAYYSVFCRAVLALHPVGRQALSDKPHDSLWSEFTRMGRAHHDLAEKGKRLKRLRQLADYDGEFPALEKECEKAMHMARALGERIDLMNRQKQ